MRAALLVPALVLSLGACDAEEARPPAEAPPAAGAAAAAAEAAVRAVVDGFKGALAEGDSLSALATLSDSVTVFEGGRAEDKDQYRSGHLAADMAFLAAVPPELVEESLLVRGDVALYTSRYRSVGTFRDRAIDRTGAETLVLLREGEGWKIRHVHW